MFFNSLNIKLKSTPSYTISDDEWSRISQLKGLEALKERNRRFTDDLAPFLARQKNCWPHGSHEEALHNHLLSQWNSSQPCRKEEYVQSARAATGFADSPRPVWVCRTAGFGVLAAMPDAISNNRPVIFGSCNAKSKDGYLFKMRLCTDTVRGHELGLDSNYLPGLSAKLGRSRPKFRLRPSHYCRMQFILAVANSFQDTPNGLFVGWKQGRAAEPVNVPFDRDLGEWLLQRGKSYI